MTGEPETARDHRTTVERGRRLEPLDRGRVVLALGEEDSDGGQRLGLEPRVAEGASDGERVVVGAPGEVHLAALAALEADPGSVDAS